MKKAQDTAIADAAALVNLQRVEKKFPHVLGEVDKQANVSMYYGFIPVKTPELSKDDLVKAKQFAPRSAEAPKLPSPAFLPEERIALLRSYVDNEMHVLPQPVMVYYKKPVQGRRNPREAHIALDVLGTARAIGEALIIASSVAILNDEGFTSLSIELNSVGEKDSMAKHDKELCLYLRKHAHNLPAKHRMAFKQNPCAMLHCDDPELAEFRENAPKSVSCLPESGRKHLMELLEYVETLDVPYRINHTLLGHRGVSNHCIFQIKDANDDSRPPLAYGFRYNMLSRKLGFKKELPAVGVSISYRRPEGAAEWKPITNPRFYFVQFGDTARLRSLRIIEMLRREHIAVYHSLTKDKLIGQITAAENLKVPYVIIMGQKEAIENTVVVRDMNTRAQETVEVGNLIHYLKRLR